ncbi:MAG: nicotinate phosphoribosyltransferase, partial [Treponema sp.]|nr:nicotinate phosphoribosyltransferase [Treponema sp.]
DCFLRDFQLTFSTLFSGVRHDSGDPIEWGEKMIAHYKKLGIDPAKKTLLFSDSLDFERATKIYRHFKDRTRVAFGIGTFLVNDTCVEPLNIVMKTVKANGIPVVKISDSPGKGIGENKQYEEYLQRAINWRLGKY